MSGFEPVYALAVAHVEDWGVTGVIARALATLLDPDNPQTTVERIELQRLCGQMVRALDYLEVQARLRRMESGLDTSWSAGLDMMARQLREARDRLIEIADALPEGPLEAFGRIHPMRLDDLDGPFCGFGDGRRSCPVPDLARHWDAWELLGTRTPRPPEAQR